MVEAVSDYATETAGPAQASLRQLPGMSLLGIPETRPQVYLSLTEHWAACTLRYVVHARSRRAVKHRLQSQVLKALATEAIAIASPAISVVRSSSERTWREPS
jgi:hypothetical protein